MREQIQSLTLQRTDELDGLMHQLRTLAARDKLPEPLITDIMVIADEILSNLLKYGGGDRLELNLYRRPGDIELLCIDNGTAFNPLLADRPDLDLPIEKREIGGLGLELVLAMTDTQDYRREANQNFLTLTLPLP
ncbi:ATP-binding protein [Gilvimarinus algae]|uniref:ATP-binding protein n=1 Tax=Gilvimarinus algae TaxID=3058037 RepID=A0ABT8TGM6_9GAMM|nr:ATP-binding protein [Gilvimarinus sp. SDUM040014]MDO3383061.1 ATP-binding protein [Gilvimarinus sp. SDUM040014]